MQKFSVNCIKIKVNKWAKFQVRENQSNTAILQRFYGQISHKVFQAHSAVKSFAFYLNRYNQKLRTKSELFGILASKFQLASIIAITGSVNSLQTQGKSTCKSTNGPSKIFSTRKDIQNFHHGRPMPVIWAELRCRHLFYCQIFGIYFEH